MLAKNEGSVERLFRFILGIGLVSWGYWISGPYWLGYQIPRYQIPCWEWSSFITHGCMVERGFIIAAIGLIPLITGLIGWCPIKYILRIKA